jgi:hypothetical protein
MLLGMFFTPPRPWTRIGIPSLQRGLQLSFLAPHLHQLSPDLEISDHPLPQSPTRGQKSDISTDVQRQTRVAGELHTPRRILPLDVSLLGKRRSNALLQASEKRVHATVHRLHILSPASRL